MHDDVDEKGADWRARKKYEYSVSAGDDSHAARLIDWVGRRRRVLEVGCASGSQTRVLVEEFDCSVTGLEIDPVAAERARPYCERLFVADLETVELSTLLREDDAFDVVLCADVLEHLRDPVRALQKCLRYLAPGGVVIVSVPNVTHASIAFELAHGRFEYQDKGLLDDTHIRFFSRSSIIRALLDADLLVERLERRIAEPRYTEFATTPRDAHDRRFLGYLSDHNPESATYQFLIQAVPMSSETSVRQASIHLRQQVEDLEKRLHEAQRELNRAQSELSWLKANPVRALFSSLRGRQAG